MKHCEHKFASAQCVQVQTYAGVHVKPYPPPPPQGGVRDTTGLSGVCTAFTVLHPRGLGAFVGFRDPKSQISKSPHIPLFDVGIY